jgi:chemotaxis signal transduction protein
MLPSADFRSSSTALLVVESGSHNYAIPGACVIGIEDLRSFQGAPPIDALALLGLTPSDRSEEARVVLLDAGEQEIALLVRGALSLLHPAPEEILALPPVMRTMSGLISHVALVGGKPSFLVLSPARLVRARGSSC